jgi:cytochrome c-type biogenesis protein
VLELVLDVLSNFVTSFILGLLTPLTAVCVLPLYPGFIAYLAGQLKEKTKIKNLPLLLGLLVSAGVISFMFLIGLVFTTLLEVSLTGVIGIISPIAFIVLGLFSILLIFNIDIGTLLPQIQAPTSKNPLLSSFIFGFFFGAIVIPCNPLFIAALFTKALTIMDFFSNMLSFLFFGLGLSAPLIVLSLISSAKSRSIISFLGRHKKVINVGSGIIMLAVSLYYLIFVFRVVG